MVSVPWKKGNSYNMTYTWSAKSKKYLRSMPWGAHVLAGGTRVATDNVLVIRAKHLFGKIYASGKIVGMICHAGLVGISAGIVRGHAATGSEGIKDDLINAGAEWRDEPAFRDGNIVWGRVVADIPDFCRELVNALES